MTVRALAERLGTVWGRAAVARGEGAPQPGMSPGPLPQDQPFIHPPPPLLALTLSATTTLCYLGLVTWLIRSSPA